MEKKTPLFYLEKLKINTHTHKIGNVRTL